MTNYKLTTERMRVVKKNERGVVVSRKQFKRNDRVTKADLEHYEGRFDSLVASGALIDEDADIETYDTLHPVVSGAGVGNAVGGTTPNVDLGFVEGGGLPEGLTLNADGSITIDPERAADLLAAVGDESPDEDGEGSEGPGEGSGEGEEPDEDSKFDPDVIEDFSEMDYPTLQRLAKARTGNGAGGKDDLIARLEAHAAENR